MRKFAPGVVWKSANKEVALNTVRTIRDRPSVVNPVYFRMASANRPVDKTNLIRFEREKCL